METIIGHVRKRFEEKQRSVYSKWRPFVTLTYAQSVDGRIAATRDTRLVLSSSKTMEMTHELRAFHDAILVGVGTVIADNPRLTVRLQREAEHPIPVILDSRCRIGTAAALFDRPNRKEKPLVYTVPLNEDGIRRKEALERNAAVEVVSIRTDDKHQVHLDSLLQDLRGRGVKSVMVEGGSQVNTSFLKRPDLIDMVVLTISPTFVGRGVHSIDTRETLHHQGILPRVENALWVPLGVDVVLLGSLSYHWPSTQ